MDYRLTQLPWYAASLESLVPLEHDPIPLDTGSLYETLSYTLSEAWDKGAPQRDLRRRMVILFQDWFHYMAKERFGLSPEQTYAAHTALTSHARLCKESPIEQFNPWVTEHLWEEIKVDRRRKLDNQQIRRALGTSRNYSTSHALVFPSFTERENLEEAFKLFLVIGSYDVLCYLASLRTLSKEEVYTSSVVAAYGAIMDQLGLEEDKAFGRGTVVIELTNPYAIDGSLFSTVYTGDGMTNTRELPRITKRTVLTSLQSYGISYCHDLETLCMERAVSLRASSLSDLRFKEPTGSRITESMRRSVLQSHYLAKYYGRRGAAKAMSWNSRRNYDSPFRLYSVRQTGTPLDEARLSLKTQPFSQWREGHGTPGEVVGLPWGAPEKGVDF